MEGQREPVHLAGWREEASTRQAQQILSGSMRGGKRSRCRVSGLLSKESWHTMMKRWRISTHSCMKGRPSFLLSKPPFDSHGAVRLRSERQPPCFLREEENQRIQRSRESAAECLDGVVPG
jgi:hypothetical protein